MGKRLAGVQVADARSGAPIRLSRALLRTVVKLFPWELAHLTNNLPVPMWYDPEPELRYGFIFVLLLLFVYVMVIVLTRRRQSIHDVVARTVVLCRR